jgi:hypothetical protein
MDESYRQIHSRHYEDQANGCREHDHDDACGGFLAFNSAWHDFLQRNALQK